MNRLYLFLVCLLPGMYGMYGQNAVEIRNNNLRVFLKSNGALLPSSGIHGFDYEQNGEFIPLIHFTGLWLGAKDEGGNLRFAHTQQGGRPGLWNTTSEFQKVWQVNASQIAALRQDFEDDGVIDDPVAEIFAWPGRGNPHFFDYNGFELPPDNTAGLAPFWDENGDGLYDPNDGDYPVLAIRGCEAPIIPTQMNWVAFTVLENTDHPLEISLNVFYFDCEEANPLQESIFTHYKVIDRAAAGTPALPEVRWGHFTDGDLGCPLDDYVGIFPERSAAYFYNADNQDEDCVIVQGFGANPPALGIDIYRGPIGSSLQEQPQSGGITFFNPSFGSFPPGATDPNLATEYFNYLQGKWRDGSPLTVGGIGYGGSEPAAFAFPGLPEQENGWTEWEAGNSEGDRRVLLNFEPFELVPGAVNELIAGYTVHSDGTDNLDQAAGLRDQLDVLQAYFDHCLQSNSDIPELPPCTPLMTATRPLAQEINLDIAPNPARDVVQVITDVSILSIELFDARGSMVSSSGEAEIALGHLPRGLYFIHIRTRQGIAVRKLIVE